MKSVLLPVDQSEQMPSALETGWLLANQFEATVEVPLRPAFTGIVAPDPIVAVSVPPTDWNEAEYSRGVRQSFDAFAAGHPTSQGSGARFRWRGGSLIEDGALGVLARVHDITVLSRPGSRGAHHGVRGSTVRQRAPGIDGAPTTAQDIGRAHSHSLECQHRDRAHDPGRHADPA
jgi:hypothetical protein